VPAYTFMQSQPQSLRSELPGLSVSDLVKSFHRSVCTNPLDIFGLFLPCKYSYDLILSHKPLDSQSLGLMNHLQFQKYEAMNAMGSNSSTVDVGRCTMMPVHEMDIITSFSY